MKFSKNDLAAILGCIVAIAALPTTPTHAQQERAVNQTSGGNLGTVQHAGQILRAGPVLLKLEDGELRYLRVGDKEIVRRIYFGVRDGNWATAMPRFTKMQVEKADDHFTIDMAAECKKGPVDYHWTGTVSGAADGKITFHAQGAANADFDSNRIGLCVLFGTPSLAGQAFATDGSPAQGTFPRLVAGELVGKQFHSLRYTTDHGLNVACTLEGAIFDMEDQRNWGDSSWKAYAPLPYAYKQVKKGESKEETVTISVTGVNAAETRPSRQDPVRVKIGTIVEGSRVPMLVAPSAIKDHVEFTGISFSRDKFKGKEQISWSYTPTEHLPDNDVAMENMPALEDQAKTVRSISPGATLYVGPIQLSKRGMDARFAAPFGRAWAFGLVKYLAEGGVEQAAFDLPPGPASAALEALRPYAGRPLVAVQTTPRYSHHITAFAIAGATEHDAPTVFLVNRTAHAWHAQIETAARSARLLAPGGEAKESNAQASNGVIEVEVAPYGVLQLIEMN